MKKLLPWFLLLLGCGSYDPTPTLPEASVEEGPDGGGPRPMPSVRVTEDPCDKVQVYEVYGRVIKVPTWCDPKPFIYKGYPSPVDR